MSVAGNIDQIEPFRLFIPLRLHCEVEMELLRTTTSLNELETLFVGTVRQPKLKGRKMSVTVQEWGDIMETELPGFHIQTKCNYQVYDPDTCRASRASKEVAVTVTDINQRIITLQGDGLAGKEENWFAGGWLDAGTGLGRRVLLVMASSVAVANRMSVTVNIIPDLEIPFTGTIVPGCDGRRTTCVNKFGNLVNFGGHETPRDNLTLAAIKTPPNSGGKK